MEVLALIPARGGSKSIPYKNIYPIRGKPLIAYTIIEAKRAKLVSRVIVSTDDEKIVKVARRYGAEVPFLRPKRYAGDLTPDLPVFQHAIRWLWRHERYRPDIMVHLWPTSPLRFSKHIDEGVRMLVEHPEVNSVRSVSTPPQTPFKMWLVKGRARPMQPLLKMLYPRLFRRKIKPFALPRQALPRVFVQNGYFQMFWPKTLLEKVSMFGDRVLPFVVPDDLYTEFDSMKDLKHAEWQLARYRK